MHNRHPSEHGQALILIVFGIMAMFGITALAVDGGSAYADRRRVQNAADAAALAGALARINGESWVQTTYQVARQNGYDNNGTGNVVEIHSPPVSGSYAGDIEYIQVRITSHLRTYFASVIGIPQITNVAEAVARSKPAQYKPMFDGAAVVSLAPSSDCDENKSFWMHAEATLDITGGGVFVNSNNPTCALMQQANGSIRINDGFPIQVVGEYDIKKPALLTPYPPTTNAAAVPYPPPFFMPKVGCPNEAEISLDGHTMSPGNWGDPFPPPGVVSLESGIYCLDGDFTMGGGVLEGGEILIYMKHGQLHISGAAQVNLTAHHGGKYAGLLIYQPIDNTHLMVLNGNEKSSYMGAILAPGAPIKIKGNDSTFGFHGQIIGYTIEGDGNSNVVIKYVDDENYDALYMPEVQFTK